MTPNHSRFPAIDEKDILSGTRVMAALDKVGSQYLRTEFLRDTRRFLEELVNFLLSTVASMSLIGQGMSCFYTAIVIVGDDAAPFQLFNKLMDGPLEKGWTRGSQIKACRSEYQSIMQDQRQLQRSSTRSRSEVGDVLSFCSAQVGFRGRQHLYKIYIVSNNACCFALSWVVSLLMALWSLRCSS